MTPRRGERARSRSLLAVMLAVIAPPAIMLLWLGWQFVKSDRALLEQHETDGRRAAGQAAVHSLVQLLQDAEGRLSAGPVPTGMVRFTVTSTSIEAQPADGVLWLPTPPSMQSAEPHPFADAEHLEFQGMSHRALMHYQELSRLPTPATRAGALVRIARVHRAAGRWDEALGAYRKLTEIRDVTILDTPVDLLARRALCATLEQAGRMTDLASESASLESDVLAGRWALDRPGWELTVADVERWRGHPLGVNGDRRLFSMVGELVWHERQNQANAAAGRRVIMAGDMPVTVLARSTGGTAHVLAVSPTVIQDWVNRVTDAGQSVRLTLLEESGRVLVGPRQVASDSTLEWEVSDTGLPWILAVGPGNSTGIDDDLAARRRLLSLGLAAILLLLGGGAYFLWRVVQRELAVARLQTEFVAAVSHEFRTPLTSLRHVTELLDEDDNLPPARRRAFYQALGRNTERLHRLVESLLDFARMESRKKPYDLQARDAGALVRNVVREFQQDAAPRDFTIALDIEDTEPFLVRADADALPNAIWNLLDNAVKYSPGGHLVHVRVHGDNSLVVISVRDHGLGIPRREQKEIFARFVRGAQAREHGIKGTGLGLAMAAHIVEAHGGRIKLKSDEGLGSTFGIVLPRLNQPGKPAAASSVSDATRATSHPSQMEARP